MLTGGQHARDEGGVARLGEVTGRRSGRAGVHRLGKGRRECSGSASRCRPARWIEPVELIEPSPARSRRNLLLPCCCCCCCSLSSSLPSPLTQADEWPACLPSVARWRSPAWVQSFGRQPPLSPSAGAASSTTSPSSLSATGSTSPSHTRSSSQPSRPSSDPGRRVPCSLPADGPLLSKTYPSTHAVAAARRARSDRSERPRARTHARGRQPARRRLARRRPTSPSVRRLIDDMQRWQEAQPSAVWLPGAADRVHAPCVRSWLKFSSRAQAAPSQGVAFWSGRELTS
jgi:hypothetical protein